MKAYITDWGSGMSAVAHWV